MNSLEENVIKFLRNYAKKNSISLIKEIKDESILELASSLNKDDSWLFLVEKEYLEFKNSVQVLEYLEPKHIFFEVKRYTNDAIRIAFVPKWDVNISLEVSEFILASNYMDSKIFRSDRMPFLNEIEQINQEKYGFFYEIFSPFIDLAFLFEELDKFNNPVFWKNELEKVGFQHMDGLYSKVVEITKKSKNNAYWLFDTI